MFAFWLPGSYAAEVPNLPDTEQHQKKRKHLKPRKHKHGHLKHRTLSSRKKKGKAATKNKTAVLGLPGRSVNWWKIINRKE